MNMLMRHCTWCRWSSGSARSGEVLSGQMCPPDRRSSSSSTKGKSTSVGAAGLLCARGRWPLTGQNVSVPSASFGGMVMSSGRYMMKKGSASKRVCPPRRRQRRYSMSGRLKGGSHSRTSIVIEPMRTSTSRGSSRKGLPLVQKPKSSSVQSRCSDTSSDRCSPVTGPHTTSGRMRSGSRTCTYFGELGKGPSPGTTSRHRPFSARNLSSFWRTRGGT
mmetsp:Transcript_39932/g.132095  ORF Transcript_39932/g.132095 Transcript_39932/m.132095 type:complete len:218 (+) Transcript_39932:339-992(+)